MSDHQYDVLGQISDMVFHTREGVRYGRECKVGNNRADYLLSIDHGIGRTPKNILLEIQCSGVAVRKSLLDEYVMNWEDSQYTSSRSLRKPVPGCGTMERSSWYPLYSQMAAKGSLLMHMYRNAALVACVGEKMFDLITSDKIGHSLPVLENKNWSLCVMCYAEDKKAPITVGAIPMHIDPTRCFYTDFDSFMHAMTHKTYDVSDCMDIFSACTEELIAV